MIRRPPRSTRVRSSAASDVYKRQDFQHHFTPRELFKEDLGDKLIIAFDETGAPSYTSHKMLYDLDEHIRMMDLAGIDAAFLTCAAGMCAELEKSKFINDKAKQ